MLLFTKRNKIFKISDGFAYKVKREIPDNIASLQKHVQLFADYVKSYEKQLEEKRSEIKHLEAKIAEYTGIKNIWIKEVEKEKIQLENYKAFYEQLKGVE